MTTIVLEGRINETGELQIEKPQGLRTGKVKVTITELTDEKNENIHELRPWTEDEIHKMMQPAPKTGAEIVALLDQLDLSEWRNMDIPDVVAWLKERREQGL
jgi:hypothetical protein